MSASSFDYIFLKADWLAGLWFANLVIFIVFEPVLFFGLGVGQHVLQE
jgi:hypothetical protein